MTNDKSMRHRGQGLVEFALILPLLLLIIIGIIEFGRILFIYVNVSNAAREGARYGIVKPKDQAGITGATNEQLALIPPVSPTILYDHGPSNPTKFSDPASVSVGDRVCVGITYVIEPMTPLMQPFMGAGMNFETENCRTIQSTGTTGWTSPGDPLPGVIFTNTPTSSPTPTETPTATPTLDPSIDTDTPTVTPEVSDTPTPTPLPPIIITKPVEAGDTSIVGEAADGYAVTLRVVQTGLQRTVTVAAGGAFTFGSLPPMIEGHTVVVQGYGSQDLAIVQPSSASPTPTETPSAAFIYADVSCLEPGATSVLISGGNWPTGSSPKVETVAFYWDSDPALLTPIQATNRDYNIPTFDILLEGITVPNPPPNSHTLIVQGTKKGKIDEVYLTLSLTIPVCQATPTPSPTPDVAPDLTITNLTVTDVPLPGTYERVHLSVSVMNNSETDVTSLFWVDLFADPDQTGDTWWQAQPSVDYVGINALAGGSTITFTMYVPNGFTTVGVPHTLIAMVDTWSQITEDLEDNNLSPSQTITLTTANLPPSPTPEVTFEAAGIIGGVTYMNETSLEQAYVSIYLYDADGRLWGSGRSDDNGNYELLEVPVGEYTLVGQLRLADELYMAMEPVIVTPSSYVAVNLFLELLP